MLDYAKGSIDNQEEKDARVANLEELRENAESRVTQGKTQIENLEKELQAKNSLIEQVKLNLEEMRAEKITMQAHMNTIEAEKQDAIKRAEGIQNQGKQENENYKTQIAEKEAKISTLEQQIKGREDQVKTNEQRLDVAIRAENRLKEQLVSEYTRA